MALVDRPHVVLQRREFRPWRSREFDDAVERITTRPARARLKVERQGPFAMQTDGRLVEERDLVLLPGAAPDTSGVAAFVQNGRTAEVLQAVLLPACSP